MSYKIGSFNICNFNDPQRSNRQQNHDINLIARIIRNEQFDVIALQEVLCEEILRDYLMPVLNRGKQAWEYRWAKPSKSDSYEAEGYAFIWNTRTMELSYSNYIEYSNGKSSMARRKVEPRIYDQYKIDPKKGEFQLARNPYYGRFKPINGFCEIRLINTHIRSGKDSDDHYWDLYELKEVAQRVNEALILNKVIYHNLSNRRYGNNMPAYTILLGDYNLNLKSSDCGQPLYPGDQFGVIVVDDNGTKQYIRTVQEETTSLRKPRKEDRNKHSAYGFANNYDHFSYDEDRFNGIGKRSKRLDSVKKYCNNDFRKHLDVVSDHVPIMMRLDLKNEDVVWED